MNRNFKKISAAILITGVLISGLLIADQSRENDLIESALSDVEKGNQDAEKVLRNLVGKNVHMEFVNGTPRTNIWIFSSPDCKHCKELEGLLEEYDDIRIRLVMTPTTERSKDLIESIWCNSDRYAAWKKWMLEGEESLFSTCGENFLDLSHEISQLNVLGTPTIYLENGARMVGVPTSPEILRRFVYSLDRKGSSYVEPK